MKENLEELLNGTATDRMKRAAVGERITWTGFWSVNTWMSSMVCFTIRQAMSFFPLFLPCFMRVQASLSTMGHYNINTEKRKMSTSRTQSRDTTSAHMTEVRCLWVEWFRYSHEPCGRTCAGICRRCGSGSWHAFPSRQRNRRERCR